MTFTKKAATFLATIVLSTTTSTVIVTNAQAATFTKDEIQEVHQIQNQYKNLPKENFNADNLYASTPHLQLDMPCRQVYPLYWLYTCKH